MIQRQLRLARSHFLQACVFTFQDFQVCIHPTCPKRWFLRVHFLLIFDPAGPGHKHSKKSGTHPVKLRPGKHCCTGHWVKEIHEGSLNGYIMSHCFTLSWRFWDQEQEDLWKRPTQSLQPHLVDLCGCLCLVLLESNGHGNLGVLGQWPKLYASDECDFNCWKSETWNSRVACSKLFKSCELILDDKQLPRKERGNVSSQEELWLESTGFD